MTTATKQVTRQPKKGRKARTNVHDSLKWWIARQIGTGAIMNYEQLLYEAKTRRHISIIAMAKTSGRLIVEDVPAAIDQTNTVSVKLPDGSSAMLLPQRMSNISRSSQITVFWFDNAKTKGFKLLDDLEFNDNLHLGNYRLRGFRSDHRNLGRDCHPVSIVLKLDDQHHLAIRKYENYFLSQPADRAKATVGQHP